MISLSLPRSRNTCGWSNGGLAPTHMNSCEPISMTGTPASLWKCGTTLSAIDTSPSVANGSERNQREVDAIEKPRTIPVVPADSYSPEATICPYKFDTIVSSEKPFFRRGRCVVNSAHYLQASGNIGLSDEAAADQYSSGGHSGKLRFGRGRMAACARGGPVAGRAGRSGCAIRGPGQLCSAK